MDLSFLKSRKRIYLDYAAATPVSGAVQKAMSPYWQTHFGNPGSISKEGVVAKSAITAARKTIAEVLRVKESSVTFTSGGTESNNLALLGSVGAIVEAGVPYGEIEIISTPVEHPSISRGLEALEKKGCRITHVPVDEEGIVDYEQLESLFSPRTRFVTIAYANSETGVVQDLGRIGRMIKAYEKKNNISITFHTDASQAPLWLPCALDALSVDMMTLDAGKCGGPKGAGVLIHRKTSTPRAIVYGGSQESGLRPGTENVPLIVGCAKAIELAQEDWESRSKKVSRLRDIFINELETVEGLTLNGSRTERLANNVNVSMLGLDTEYAVVVLDKEGVAASTKSACSGAGSGRSEVVYSMTKDEGRANSTIRFSLGENTTGGELKQVAELLRTHVDRMKSFSSK